MIFTTPYRKRFTSVTSARAVKVLQQHFNVFNNSHVFFNLQDRCICDWDEIHWIGGELECTTITIKKNHLLYRVRCKSCVLNVIFSLSLVTGETVFEYGFLPYNCYRLGYVFKKNDLLCTSAHRRMLRYLYGYNLTLFYKIHELRTKFGSP